MSREFIQSHAEKWMSCIGLYQPKSASNVWWVLRAAGIYWSSFVAIQDGAYKWYVTDTNKEYRRTPVFNNIHLKDIVPFDCVPVCVELKKEAQNLINYRHPKSAFYIFWPEDWDVSDEVINICRDIVYIPGNYCMNLAAAVNVVLYDRMAKKDFIFCD